VSTASLLSYVDGIEQEELVEEATVNRGVVIYARVSSDKQAQDGSLERQEARLRQEVGNREGVSPKAFPVYSDVASSFGNREGLNKLIDAMLEGRVKKIYCEYLDRLSRTPALTHLIEHLAKRQGVEIVCLDIEETDPTELEYLTKELIAFITVVSNRVSAAKSRKVTVKEVEEGTLQRLFAMRGEGLSLTAIWKEAKASGLTTAKGEALSYYKIKELLFNGKGKALGAAVGCEAGNPHEALRSWVSSNLEAVADERSKQRTYMIDIRAAYAAYCKNMGVKPLPAGDVGQAVNAVYPGRKFKTMGKVAYRGLALVNGKK
jgi:predicted site-specific integrase-resolvase